MKLRGPQSSQSLPYLQTPYWLRPPPSSQLPSPLNWQSFEQELVGGRGTGGGIGGRGAVTRVHMSDSRPRMSATVVPRYEYIDAGGVAIAFSVSPFAPPKPTAIRSAFVPRRSSWPEMIAPRSPPYDELCTPSVNSNTTCSASPRTLEPFNTRTALSRPRDMAVDPDGRYRSRACSREYESAVRGTTMSDRDENSTKETRVQVSLISNWPYNERTSVRSSAAYGPILPLSSRTITSSIFTKHVGRLGAGGGRGNE